MARPSRYRREDVLEKAMQAFWNEGYNATGMADLVSATDMRPGSLYASFNSKRELFLASIDLYGQRSVANIQQGLDSSASPLTGVRQLLRKLARDTVSKQGKRSCFLVNSVLEMARQDPAVRERVNVYFRQIESLLRRKLKQAQAEGELGADRDPRAIATFLLNNIWGLRVLAGTDPGPRRAQDIVRLALSVLD
ncbi:MAG: TetR/AcrR family transcriptional regulator [Gammaproteobacteria bacterium]|jgi:TetR/AcrR family transcriptional regulator, transcriptional repressor for nem operon